MELESDGVGWVSSEPPPPGVRFRVECFEGSDFKAQNT